MIDQPLSGSAKLREGSAMQFKGPTVRASLHPSAPETDLARCPRDSWPSHVPVLSFAQCSQPGTA